MLRALQYPLLVLYSALPLLMLFWAVRRRRRGHVAPLFTALVIFFSGFVIGVALLLLHSKLMGASMPPAEALRLIYTTIAALCLLKFIDRFLLRAMYQAIRVPLDHFGRPIVPHSRRALLGLLAQRLVMLAIIIPYAFAMLLCYRPKVSYGITPAGLRLEYSPASFKSSDGVRLAGWWIPATEMPPRESEQTSDDYRSQGIEPVGNQVADQWGKRTVVLCHGMAAGKEHVLGLAWLLAKRGFNVLAFDFRAHGDSGGNYVSYGDRERADVLAAVRWVRQQHPESAEKIFGIGINTGAAALLAAAADNHDGQCIDALVLIEPFASFRSVARSNSDLLLPRGVSWIVKNFSIPLAALHCGADLNSFSPADFLDKIWPRPILVVHGRGGSFVPTAEEMTLFQRMTQPKDQFWPADNYQESGKDWQKVKNNQWKTLLRMSRQWMGTSETVLGDRGVQYHLLRFLREAEPLPVI